MNLKLTAAVFASFVAFGSFAGFAIARPVTSSTFSVNAGDVASGVDVQVKEESGDRVIATATTSADGKFTFPDLPDGKYRLTLTFSGRHDMSGDPSKPTVRTFLLTVTAVPGQPLKKDLDLKAEQPLPAALKKLPGKRTPPTITLKRGMTRSVAGNVAESNIEGIITLG